MIEPAHIQNLRIRIPGPPSSFTGMDPLLARLRLGSLLDRLDLQAGRPGSSAVLCIRRFEDPQPGHLSLEGGQALPQAWESSARQAVERLASGAAHPAHEVVPASANAVLFNDRAELLACLAADWCSGETQNRWWWQSWLVGADLAQSVREAWLETPEYVPGGLLHLAQMSRSSARTQISPSIFLARLGLQASRALLDGVLRRFDLQGLQTALSDGPGGAGQFVPVKAGEPTGFPIHPGQSGTIAEVNETLFPSSVSTWEYQPKEAIDRLLPSIPPWQLLAPEAVDGSYFVDLDRVQQALLGISLALARAPVEVQTRRFALQAVAWWWEQGRSEGKPLLEKSAISAVTPEELAAKATAMTSPPDSGQTLEIGPSEAMNPAARDLLGRMEKTAAQQAAQIPGLEPAVLPPAAPVSSREPLTSGTPPFPELSFMEVETSLGGLFYLVNLAIFLGLYRDFSSPNEPGLALSLWVFISRIGQRLLVTSEGQYEKYAEDPIWDFLDHMAGADRNGFIPPGEWRLPVSWLKDLGTLPSGDWIWRAVPPLRDASGIPAPASAERLLVDHSLGFRILDLPLEGRTAASLLQEELAPYRDYLDPARGLRRDTEPHARDLWSATGAGLDIWLDGLAGFIRFRLALALRTPLNFAAEAAVIGERLFLYPARVRVTTTHLEVYLSLSHLPVEIRLSGLDRDPGWVPAAGRFIRFIYEE